MRWTPPWILSKLHARFTQTDENSEEARQFAYMEMRKRNLLQRGMTRAQIYQLLGEPSVYCPEARFSDNWTYEEWRYALPGGGLGEFGADQRVAGYTRWYEDEGHTKPETW
jgi:hypothetical protein